MPYSELLLARVRDLIDPRDHLVEKKMFGGICFLYHGNLMVAVWNEALIVRLGVEQAGEALKRPHVKPFDVTGRPMKGWALVESKGLRHDRELAKWLSKAKDFVATLPAK